jgi:broad specificity phosphatase PhoE
VRLVLVRHGEAAAGWTDDLDPGLSDLGRRQAEEVAEHLATLGPVPILSSPMNRCRQTAAPLAERWGVTPTVDAAVGEIQAPDHDVATRGPWLATVMSQRWTDLPPDQQAWRAGVIERLLSLTEDTVVFTHFIAINAALGSATADGRVVNRRVANCSTTVLDSDGESLMLLEAPSEVERTEVL